MATVGNKISHGIDIHKHAIFAGSTVMVMSNHPGLTEDDYKLRLPVKELRPLGAVLDFHGIQKVIPHSKLLLCRSETDKIDSMGYPLKVGDGVTICCYGGIISKNDIGSRGVIEKLNKKSAKVHFLFNFDKTKNIPYNYLRK